MDLSQLSDADLDAQIAANAPKQNYSDLSAMSDADLDAAITANTPNPPSLVDRANAWMYNHLPASFNNVANSLVDPYTYVNAAKHVVGGTKKLIGDASGTAMEFMQNPIDTINNVGNAFSYPITNAVTNGINKLTGSNLAQLPAQGGTSAEGFGDDIRNILPYVAANGLAVNGLEAALPLANSLWRDILARTLSTGAVSGAQGQNPVEGAAANLIGEGIGPVANASVSPAKTLVNSLTSFALNKSGKFTDAGNKVYPDINTPQEASKIVQNLPSTYKPSLGTVTGLPAIQSLESSLSSLPFNSMDENLQGQSSDTQGLANNIMGELLGTTSPEKINDTLFQAVQKTPFSQEFSNHKADVLESLNANQDAINNNDNTAKQLVFHLMGGESNESLLGGIQEGVSQAEQSAKQAMQDKYVPINNYAQNSGFNATEKPALSSLYQQKLADYNNKVQSKLIDPNSSTGREYQTRLNELKTLAETPYESSVKPIIDNLLGSKSSPPNPISVTLPSLMENASDFKSRARQASQYGDTQGQKFYNDVAQAYQKDYSHNAARLNIPDIKQKIEDAHSFAKNNYYDIWDRGDIQNVSKGNSNSVIGTLTGNKNQDLLSTLSPSLKRKIFMASIGDKLKTDDQGNPVLSAKDISDIYNKQGASSGQKLHNLLSPEEIDMMKQISEKHQQLSSSKDILQKENKSLINNPDNHPIFGDIFSNPNKDFVKELSKKENLAILAQLPQDAKNLVYTGQLKNAISNTGSGINVDPSALVKHFSNKEANNAQLNDRMLSPQLQKKMQQLQTMAKITNNSPKSGSLKQGLKEALTLSGLGAVGKFLGVQLPLSIATGIGGGHYLAKRLTNPDAISRYTQGKLPYDINQYPAKIIRGGVAVGNSQSR